MENIPFQSVKKHQIVHTVDIPANESIRWNHIKEMTNLSFKTINESDMIEYYLEELSPF